MIPPAHKLHAIAVHYPLALLTVYLLLDAVALALRREKLARFALILLWMGAAGAVAAFLTGDEAEESAQRTSDAMGHVLHEHEELAETAMFIFLALAVVRTIGSAGDVIRPRLPAIAGQWDKPRLWHGLYLLVALGATILLLYVGHLGGQLVYDYGANVATTVIE